MPLCVGAQDTKLVSGFVAQRVLSLTHFLENVALLTDRSLENCGRHCLLSSSVVEIVEILRRMFCFNLESIKCRCLTARSQW